MESLAVFQFMGKFFSSSGGGGGRGANVRVLLPADEGGKRDAPVIKELVADD